MVQALLLTIAVIALKIYLSQQKKLKKAQEDQEVQAPQNDLGVYWESKNDLFFLADKDGKQLSEDFNTVMDFSEGLAAAERAAGKDPNFGYIDVSGKYVIQPIYEDAKDFKDGKAKVKLNGQWIQIDKKGKRVS